MNVCLKVLSLFSLVESQERQTFSRPKSTTSWHYFSLIWETDFLAEGKEKHDHAGPGNYR